MVCNLLRLCWITSIICFQFNHFIFYRSGQDRISAKSWKPRNLSKSFWYNWTLLWHWRRGQKYCSSNWWKCSAIPIYCWSGCTNGWISILNQFSTLVLNASLSSAHKYNSLYFLFGLFYCARGRLVMVCKFSLLPI